MGPAAPRKQANASGHEVFAHHFRLPRRGEEMAHADFAMLFRSQIDEEEGRRPPSLLFATQQAPIKKAVQSDKMRVDVAEEVC